MNAKTLGLIGAIVVGLSLVLPSVSMPIVGAINYYKTDYILPAFLISAALGIFGALRSSRIMLLIAGAISGAANIIFIVRLGQVVDEMKADAGDGEGLAGAIGEAMSNAIQIQFGVFVSLIGVVLLIIAGIMAAKEQD
jgi:hypothetical protein